jgi:hypothetical protein
MPVSEMLASKSRNGEPDWHFTHERNTANALSQHNRRESTLPGVWFPPNRQARLFTTNAIFPQIY